MVQFNLPKEEYGVEGIALNKDNNAPVAGASVSLIDKASGKVLTATSDDKGVFRFSVKPNLEYMLRVEKAKYLTSNVPLSTKGMAIGVKKQNVLMEELVVGKSIKIDNVYYDQGKWDIRADAKPELDKMVVLMNENPTMEVELSSHTDSRGSDASNMTLSDKRAKSVVAYIVSKGISSSRLIAKGYGESKLLNGCINGKKCSDAEHQINRRTEFKILKM
jgi:outer membrane protein OmpA-like peptidoglycan-associated protein